MASSDLIRWGGLAAILSGVAFIVMFLLAMVIPEPPPDSFSDTVFSAVFIVALLLVLTGLAGFHALQKENYGRIGRAGFYTVIVGTSAQILAQVVLLLGSTALELLDFLGLLAVMVGVRALRSGHLAGEGVAALVWGRVHSRLACMDSRIYGLGRVWGSTWGNTVWSPVGSAGLHAVVAKGRLDRTTLARELDKPIA